MRHFLIDTDTASDDAVALLMALREPSIKIEAITVVAGNCPLKTAVRNALISVEKANTYFPPVYVGALKPLIRELHSCVNVHGEDGMGDINLTAPTRQAETEHAVDKIIQYAEKFKGELEVITIGPLTNLAIALAREPRLTQWIKHLFIMGSEGLGPGNITPAAEFNFWVDAEAAHLVVKSEVPKTIIGWDVCMDEAFLSPDDIRKLEISSELGKFAVQCNKTVIEFTKSLGREGISFPDPTAIAAAIYPEMIVTQQDYYGVVDYKSELGYGQFIVDQFGTTGKATNHTLVTKIDAGMFKIKLINLLSD
ncbi:ribonucleoside hydrolase [Shewanella sp. OPT22]|nr:ribonucleoside hydrolase [Shewanella sp. OPT22]